MTDAELNQEAWLAHLRSTPREEWPAWATISKVTVVPFYDRTGLIYETLGTLNEAISLEILVTIIVVLVMVVHLRSSVLISGMLPLAVLLCFVGMKFFGVQANIVALSGIAIAIGTIVDMGIVICENILRHLDEAAAGRDPSSRPTFAESLEIVHRAASEVGGAVLTAVMTTVVSFLPVFTMIGAEGKLFKPLAYTKTFALVASIMIALTVLPPMAHVLFCGRISGRKLRIALNVALIALGVVLAVKVFWLIGADCCRVRSLSSAGTAPSRTHQQERARRGDHPGGTRRRRSAHVATGNPSARNADRSEISCSWRL